MDFSAYEKGNPFMSYNHIQICKVDPDCCVVKVNLVAESMNLHGHVHEDCYMQWQIAWREFLPEWMVEIM